MNIYYTLFTKNHMLEPETAYGEKHNIDSIIGK